MLSVVILTKNEEAHIIDAIESVEFADEIVIIDDYSQDHTVEAISAKRDPRIKIHKRRLDDFSSQRNFAMKKTSGDYILFLDADERVTPALAGEIQHVMHEKKNISGFYIPRTDIIWNKKLLHGETASVRLLRLAKKNKGDWEGKVHEKWNIQGKTINLTYPLHHYPHPTVNSFLAKVNTYTTIRAQELFSDKTSVSLLDIVAYPTGKFLQNYILHQGYKDGVAGFVHAGMMSFHSYLVRAKLWLHWQKR